MLPVSLAKPAKLTALSFTGAKIMTVHKKINIILLGLGKVGQELANQVLTSRSRLQKDRHLELGFTTLADSRAVLHAASGLTDQQIRTAITQKAAGRSLADLPASQAAASLNNLLHAGSILVDTTASVETMPLILSALHNGCGVVLANKHPLSAPWEQASPLFGHPRLRCEATVGAGLPVMAALRDLLATGDTVTAIQGCLSGTLGFLCTRLEQGVSYSAAVNEARQLGYTEPDPRQDLSGLDVARKAVILARTAGMPLEMDNLPIEKLYSDQLASLSLDDFLTNIGSLDEVFQQRLQPALAECMVPRYVARISAGKAAVGLEIVAKSSALGALQGPDNYFALTTARYADTPLVIAGPGAGVAVTAAGVFSDILHLAV
jgi:homoserine dehydrogenase